MDELKISPEFDRIADFILYKGDCLDLLPHIPTGFVKLVVTSPPYNSVKSYKRRLDLDEHLSQQRKVIKECVRELDEHGSIWTV